MLDLLFESMIKPMSQITYEEICYDYWDPELFNGTLPDEHIFNQKEG